MKRFHLALAIAISATLFAGKTVSAQSNGQMQFASYSSMQEMVDRIESLEASLASYSTDGDFIIDGSKGVSKCSTCGGCDCSCGGGCALYFGAEAVYAKPHFEDEVEPNDGEATYDYEISSRLYFGGRNDHGFGARVRWWQFDHNSQEGDARNDPFQLTVDAVDFEATQMVCWGPVNAMFFGGARYGKVSHVEDDGEGSTFEGTGPTVGIDLNLPIRCTNLSLIGNFRYSALFGNSRFTDNNTGEDDIVGNVETQLGIQYSHCCSRGTLNIRTVVETQQWEGAADDPTDNLDSISSTNEDLGFLGFGVGIEYVY
jgi:hypothetical protein